MLWGDRCIFFLLQIVFARQWLISRSGTERFWLMGLMMLVFGTGWAIVATCSDLFCRVGELTGIPKLHDMVNGIISVVDPVCGLGLVAAFFVWCVGESRKIRSFRLRGAV